MADSNITKRALAQALKELMMTQPLDKISVSNICEQCGLNRKSFYYHFRDKYELVSWIYYTEFMETALKKQYRDSWEFMDEICSYFYENRIFYRKCFQQEGQNSFSEYFFSVVFSIMCDHLEPFSGRSRPLSPTPLFTQMRLYVRSRNGWDRRNVFRRRNFPDFFARQFLVFRAKHICCFQRRIHWKRNENLFGTLKDFRGGTDFFAD